jgi:pimeloyl-ACP methyl ester carboxylesterase
MGRVIDEASLTPAAIEHPLPWGPVVRGMRWGSGDHTLLLLHEPGSDLDAWGALPQALACSLPITVLAIDLPGHGLSDDPWQPGRLADLVRALAEGGSGRGQFILAAGPTATLLLEIAAEIPCAGVICLSPDAISGGQPCSRSPLVAKLIFAGSLVADDLDIARQLASQSGGWTLVTSVPVEERGTALLGSSWVGRITEQIAGFLRDGMFGRRHPARRFSSPD